MKRRGFFAGITAMITGSAVAQETSPGNFDKMPALVSTGPIHSPDLPEPYASLTWNFDGDDKNLHVRISDGSSVIWHEDGKAYKLRPTRSIVTMPDPRGISTQIKLAKSIFMLEEV